ncbi:YhcN/YlaJ family sporulation lipoprotein [Paenibacillus zeisoli]|uniref:YhcN/YlaJ family sporulation lipoprotein n=1 Tax=Paenibacillus zeisoli TaxID=2496267 RepID=A0A3S1JTH9_9BACL|nr:YhcN/YlaJ family sporulation lipoprotein [Paenibacillus zeisoli]RUT36401.1 YhcN/YlaJ family sporulation lipoprotein [Paenibacillus zeisoli]
MRTWLCLILTALLLSSCGTAANKHASPSPQSQKGSNPRILSNDQTGRAHMNRAGQNQQGQYNQNNLQGQHTQNNQQGQTGQQSLQAHLESIAKRVPGVKNASCVLIGDTAVVGLDVDGNLDRSRVGTIKYSAAEALRKDPHGKNAIVTADIDLSHRISDISQSVRQGHPLSGFGNELSDIIGRIIPQMPKDVRPPVNNGPGPASKGTGEPTKLQNHNKAVHPQNKSQQAPPSTSR